MEAERKDVSPISQITATHDVMKACVTQLDSASLFVGTIDEASKGTSTRGISHVRAKASNMLWQLVKIKFVDLDIF